MSAQLDRLRASLGERYTIDGVLGQGGMATVYRGRDVRFDRAVAIKVLHDEVASSLGNERFDREIRTTARLNHPHILPLLDSGNANGLLYYVMPVVEGESLRDRLQREGEFPVGDAVRIACEVGRALGYAHAAGVLHRDIKPENVLLQGGQALLADFGIASDRGNEASLTATGLTVGTPLYMSPEQGTGAAVVDGRSDQYALACVTYELLAGEPPFTGPTPLAITARKINEPVPPLRVRRPTVPATVEAAITRALHRAPADRFASMAEFVAALEAVVPAADGGQVAARSFMGANARRLAVGAFACAALLALLWKMRADGTTASGSSSTMAVLPFDNLSSDSSQEYFVQGLADELVTSLSMVEGMRVASRTATAGLLRRGVPPDEIAEQLDVENLLEGSVRHGGDQIRVATRLVRVRDNQLVWSQTYDRSANDALRIQEEIATAITVALRGRLLEQNRGAVNSGTTDPEAYDLYLKGRAERLRQTGPSLIRAIELLKSAIARSPQFARAHADLAQSYAVQGWWEFKPPVEVFPLALEAAATATQLDPRNASALATTAYGLLYFRWDLPAAEAAFKRALAADPNSPIAHQWYANYLAVAGRLDESEQEFRTALRLDPAPPVRRAAMAWVEAYRGNAARAVQWFDDAVRIDPDFSGVYTFGAIALEEAGRLDDALRAMERAVVLSDSAPANVAGLARLHALRGNTAKARSLLAQAISGRPAPAYEVAKAHLALGERAEAMRWFEKGYDQRVHSMVFLRIDPQLKALRADPAFEALARKVGL